MNKYRDGHIDRQRDHEGHNGTLNGVLERRRARSLAAAERQAERDERTAEQQIAVLDAGGYVAKSERKRLASENLKNQFATHGVNNILTSDTTIKATIAGKRTI
jgi:hypothetical protein